MRQISRDMPSRLDVTTRQLQHSTGFAAVQRQRLFARREFHVPIAHALRTRHAGQEYHTEPSGCPIEPELTQEALPQLEGRILSPLFSPPGHLGASQSDSVHS
jgi:hypothetical protein